MEAIFLKLVNMSITASWLVLAVIAFRFLFRKIPKWIHCILWGLVAFRLICPFSIESSLSLIPSAEPISQEVSYTDVIVHPAQGDILDAEGNVIIERHPSAARGEILDSEGNLILEQKEGVTTYREKTQSKTWPSYFSKIWIIGFFGMIAYAIISFCLLKRKVVTAIPFKRGIKQSEYVDSPFVLGIINPVIYLPFAMAEGDIIYVIAHEKAHIRRKDHWWKPLGFLLLSIYWFNPLLWVAYVLLCRDIEAACDEKVIKDMKKEERQSYSRALLNCSVHRRMVAACPLAFGETGVKQRVRGVMNYKKPAFWIVLIALVVCVVVSLCFLTNPAGMHLYEIDDSRNYSDLLTNVNNLTLVYDGEDYPVYNEEDILENLDSVMVRKVTLQRTRSESRDKTCQIQIRDGTFINFSKDYSHVWIDNGMKPTYTYRVINTGTVESIFDSIRDINLKIVADEVTPEGMAIVHYPDNVYTEVNAIVDSRYYLERFDGKEWSKVEPKDALYSVSVLITEDRDRHELNWKGRYGALSDGQYRIAVDYYFPSTDTLRTLYAEFSIGKTEKVQLWFDDDHASFSDRMSKRDEVLLPGTENPVRLIHEQGAEESIAFWDDGNSEVLCSGSRIRSAYFADLSRDGVPEICTVVQSTGDPVCKLFVYDYMEKQSFEMEDTRETDYFLTEKDDCLFVLEKRRSNSETVDFGPLALLKNAGGRELQIAELSESQQALTKRIVCVDILNRKHLCLSSQEDISEIMSILQSIEKDAKPVPTAVLEDAKADGFYQCILTINYELGEKTVCLSEDFSVIWESGTEKGYRISDPSAIRSHIAMLTDGVYKRETEGEPFATADKPWEWTAGIRPDAVESAQAYALLEITPNGDTRGDSGVISVDTLKSLVEILNDIPPTAFSAADVITRQSYQEICRGFRKLGSAVSMIDPVNGFAAVIRCFDGKTELILTEELDKVESINREYLEPVQVWQIDDNRLLSFMEMVAQDPPVMTYTVGAEYQWQSPIPFETDNFALELRLIEGWEYAYVTNSTDSGIRCRPEGISDGWIYFSYWPGEYQPAEEGRYIAEGSYLNWMTYTSYADADVRIPGGVSTYGKVWSYKRYDLDKGDYVVINDGADTWFAEYKDPIQDIMTLAAIVAE